LADDLACNRNFLRAEWPISWSAMCCATSEFAVVLPDKDRAINRADVFLENDQEIAADP
jgi:hypothetical protein